MAHDALNGKPLAGGTAEYQKFTGWPELKESLMAGRVQAAFFLAPLAVRQALQKGARGYLLKGSVSEELLLAIRAAALGCDLPEPGDLGRPGHGWGCVPSRSHAAGPPRKAHGARAGDHPSDQQRADER